MFDSGELTPTVNTQEHETISPSENAINQLRGQLRLENTETAVTAIEGIKRAAINSDDFTVQVLGIEALSNFAAQSDFSINYHTQQREAQDIARDRVAAIAFSTEQQDVQVAAIRGLSRGFSTPDLKWADSHRGIVQYITLLGVRTHDPVVKNEAITALSEYAGKQRNGGGYFGSSADKDTQNVANIATGVITKP